MPGRVASSARANNGAVTRRPAKFTPSLRLRHGAVATAAEVEARVGIAHARDAHIVYIAGRLAVLFPLANPHFPGVLQLPPFRLAQLPLAGRPRTAPGGGGRYAGSRPIGASRA